MYLLEGDRLRISARKVIPMKINRFGKAEILNPQEITLLFSEGFVKPRDRALSSFPVPSASV
ncbi:MAG: hypothetical protein PUP90_25025 [Nostoc sp. S4]|nr:hypothetical protein [Nostoc sp. S4]